MVSCAERWRDTRIGLTTWHWTPTTFCARDHFMSEFMTTTKYGNRNKVKWKIEFLMERIYLTNISFVENQLNAADRFKQVCPDGVESLVSCSDDFTLYLWRSDQSKCITRMTGHQNVVNDVKYSPDVKWVKHAELIQSYQILMVISRSDWSRPRHLTNRCDCGEHLMARSSAHSAAMSKQSTQSPGQSIRVCCAAAAKIQPWKCGA